MGAPPQENTHSVVQIMIVTIKLLKVYVQILYLSTSEILFYHLRQLSATTNILKHN